MKINTDYMGIALVEAQKAMVHGDVPIGCVIVSNDKIIAKQHNRVEVDKDSTAHAELLAIREAQQKVSYKHLLNCDMYITLEPCSMCAGAIVLSRLECIYIATRDPKSGACGSVFNITDSPLLNHKCKTHFGLKEQEASDLIKSFFKNIRERNGRSS